MTPSQAAELATLSIAGASGLIKSRKLSPVELTEACLARIEQLDSKLHAFITVTADCALQEARFAEAEIQRGRWRGPLHGIAIALKDLFDTAGLRTTAGSALYQDRIPRQDAFVVTLLKQAGAVLIGKTNMHEFAFGATSASFFGRPRNPWNREHITGGSSGGSAAAVAAGMCLGALGSDTGGSVRQPAAHCGIVGHKPTYGLVSTRGAIPLSWTADHIGPLTRTVEDTAILLQALAVHDPELVNASPVYSGDEFRPSAQAGAAKAVPSPVAANDWGAPDYLAELQASVSSLRVGVPQNFFFDKLDTEVEQATRAAINLLGELTSGTREVDFPLSHDRLVVRAEAFAYHAENIRQQSELYLAETLGKLKMGESVTAADYIAALQRLQQRRREIHKVFRHFDVLVAPVSPVPPPAIADLPTDFEGIISADNRASDTVLLRNTRDINLSGLPAISVPCGFTSAGLPLGLQIIGPPGGDALVLRLAHAYEQAAAWKTVLPI